MTLKDAQLPTLVLSGTHTGPINADGLRIEHDLALTPGFHATGEVGLLGATIGGDLDYIKGRFSNPEGAALSVDGMDVARNVLLREGFEATGEVGLVGATISGNLECDTARFSNPDGKALNADGTTVKGSVIWRSGSRIESRVDFTAARVGAYFIWTDVDAPESCELTLESARIGTLWDEEESWPATLSLDGLVYDRLYNQARSMRRRACNDFDSRNTTSSCRDRMRSSHTSFSRWAMRWTPARFSSLSKETPRDFKP